MREPLNWILEVPFLGVETISTQSPFLCPAMQSYVQGQYPGILQIYLGRHPLSHSHKVPNLSGEPPGNLFPAIKARETHSRL